MRTRGRSPSLRSAARRQAFAVAAPSPRRRAAPKDDKGGRVSRRAALGLLIAPALIACGGPREATRTPTPAFVGPDVAAQRLGQEVRVRMRVQCVDVGSRVAPTCVRPTCYYEGFLFRVCIPPQLTDQFERELRGPIGERMLERVVDAVGVVQLNGQWAEIVVTSTEQLRIATGLRPPLEPTRVPARPSPKP